jgi:hypothetical protein
MRVFYRGATVSFTHTFYDSSGDVTSPSSAQLQLSYPSSGFPFRGSYETTSITLTQDTTTLVYTGAWNSANANGRGTVWYHIRSDDLTDAVEDGQFELRGNPANFSITSTT